MTWNQDSAAPALIAREAAIAKIKQMATAKGYTAGFKVEYDGEEIETPAQLPAEVNMDLVKVASKLNNAA